VNVLEALKGGAKFLKCVFSSTTSSFSSFLSLIDLSKSLESIKVNLAANFLTNSTFSFRRI
jgi:hypothetical protein